MSYENLWVVAFFHPAELDAKVPRVVGPFPAAEAAEDFDLYADLFEDYLEPAHD